MANQKNELIKFLEKRVSTKNFDFTHVSLKEFFKKSFYIEADDNKEFLDLYNRYDGYKLCLLEKPKTSQYLRFDFDLKFKNDTNLTIENINDISTIIKEEICNLYQSNFNLYILHREKSYKKLDIFKNGLHFQIPDIIIKNYHINLSICEKLISNKKLINIFKRMEVINPIKDIVDTGVYKNCWALYKSGKTDDENYYKLKYTLDKNNELKKYEDNIPINQLVNLFSFRSENKKYNITPAKNQEMENEIVKIKNEFIKIEKDKLKAKIENSKKIFKSNKNINFQEIEELCSILNNERFDNYEIWTKFCWLLKNTNEDLYYLFHKFSKTSDKYDEDQVDKFWDNAKTDSTYSIGTLKFWAKKDNPEKYKEICDKYKEYDMSDVVPKFDNDSIAKDFAKRYNDKFIFQDEVMYYFNDVYWQIDTKNRKLKNFIANEYFMELHTILCKRWKIEREKEKTNTGKNEVDQKYMDLIDMICKPLKNNNYRKNIVECIESYLINDDIEFDTKPYLFCFKNKIWDLSKGEFIKPNSLDYLTLTSGYNYEEDDDLQENMKVIDKFLKEILPNDEVRECTLKIIASGMCGRQLDKFTIFNGGGGNGKGVLDKLTLKTFGNYSCKLDNSVLTEKKNKSGGVNPAKAKLDKKRYVISTEPDTESGERFNCSIIKEITGEKTLDNARALYSSKDSISLYLTLVVECNEKPKMNEANNAMIRRIMDILFESSFVEDENDIDEKNGIYLMNKILDTEEWREQYKIAFFHYLQPYFIKLYNDGFNLNTPQIIKDRNEKYLADSNDIFSWFKSKQDEECEGSQYIEKTDDKYDYIKIVDLYNMFKDSTYFTNLNKKEKRELNKSKFIEKIIQIKQFRILYKEKYQRKVNGKNETSRNILTNFKIIYKNDFCDVDEY